MSKRSICTLVLLSALIFLISPPAVPGPGAPKLLRVNGSVHIFKGKAVCAFDIQDPKTGTRVPNCVVKVNNHPIPWLGSNPWYQAEFPVTFMAPQDFTVTIKPPSPPFEANVGVIATATIPTLANFTQPQDNSTFNRGIGAGVQLAWRITPNTSPVQIMLSDQSDNMNYTFEGISTNPYVLPWTSIPKNHSPFLATVRSFQNIHFKLTGSVAPDSVIHGMSYGMVKFNVVSLSPGWPPATKK